MDEISIADQLGKLPFRAVVAFATRCAMRVRPLSDQLPGYGPHAVERAILLADDVAKGSGMGELTAESAAQDIEKSAKGLVRIAPDVAGRSAAFAVRASGVVNAMLSSEEHTNHVEKYTEAVENAIKAAHWMVEAAKAAAWDFAIHEGEHNDAATKVAEDQAPDAVIEIKNEAQNDLVRLLGLNLGQPGHLGRPIDPSPSGPMRSLWKGQFPGWLTSIPN